MANHNDANGRYSDQTKPLIKGVKNEREEMELNPIAHRFGIGGIVIQDGDMLIDKSISSALKKAATKIQKLRV